MKLRHPLLVLTATLAFACSKERASEGPGHVASKSSTTGAETVVPLATAATATARAEAKSETAAAPKKAKQLPGASKTPKRVTVDTSAPETKVAAYAGEDVILLVPNHVGTNWQITNRDKRLDAPKMEHVAGALGPNTDADRYTFATASIPTDTAPEAVIELTNKLAPKEKHTVRIALIQMD